MKKIVCTIMAVAALAACTKSEVNYEAPAEIGFNVVAGNITKAPVDGDVYPTTLNMYVNAYVHNTSAPTTPDYINNGEFTYLSTYGAYDSSDESATDAEKGTNVWGGGSSSSDRNPYYWPNEQKLHFSGYSKSGSFNSASYNPSTDVLTISDYNPGASANPGANDLMWFPSTKYAANGGYDKNTKFVPVNMYHTCAWITFLVQGDATTGSSSSSYKITSLKMNGVDQTADVTCTGNTSLSATTLPTYVVWTNNTDQVGDNVTIAVSVPADGVALSSTYSSESSKSPKNIESGASNTTDGNIVVIPQKPGTIDLAWTYSSSTTNPISDTATGLSLKLTTDETDVKNVWEPGKHYIYTITIKANEILVAPTPVDWVNAPDQNVTVE